MSRKPVVRCIVDIKLQKASYFSLEYAGHVCVYQRDFVWRVHVAVTCIFLIMYHIVADKVGSYYSTTLALFILTCHCNVWLEISCLLFGEL